MASKVEILIQAQDKASKQLAGVRSEMEKLSGKTKTLGSSFSGLKGIIGAVSFWAIQSAISSLIKESESQIRVNNQLNAVLKSTGGVVGYTSNEIQNMATAMSYELGIADDVIQQGQNMLLTFTNIGQEVFPLATATMLDMATAMNGGVTPGAEQLSGTAIQLGKALQDPILGMSALRRVGVNFNEESRNTIESFLRVNDLAGAQKFIIAELNKEFGGSAAAQATVSKKMQVAWGELKETLGNVLLPTANMVFEKIREISTKTNISLSKDVDVMAESVKGFAKSIFDAVSTAVKGLGMLFGAIIGGYNSAEASQNSFGQNFAKTIQFVGTTLQAIVNIIKTVGGALGTFLSGPIAMIDQMDKGFQQGGMKGVIAGFKGIGIGAKAWGQEIGSYVKDTKNMWTDFGVEVINTNRKIASGEGLESISGGAGLFSGLSGAISNIGSGGGGAKQKIDEVSKSVEDLQKTMKDLGYVDSTVSKASIEAKRLDKQAIDELGTYYKGLKDKVQSSFDGINDKIKSSYDNIFDYKKQIIDLGKEIDKLKGQQSTDVAKSYVESVQKIKQLQDEINSGQGSDDIYKQMAQEQKNLQSAFAGLSETEKTALQEKIDKETAYQAMTGIEKIRADYAEKIQGIQNEIAEKTKAIDAEMLKIQELNTQKATLEAKRMNTLRIDHAEQIKMYNQLIDKAKELASARSGSSKTTTNSTSAKASGGPVNGGQQYIVGEQGPEYFTPAVSGFITPNDKISGGSTVNINLGGVVINNDADENRLVDKIKKTLTRELELYKMGVY